MTATLDHLLIGAVAPIGSRGVPSGIDKRSVDARIWLGREGCEGDAQGDRKRHGGPEKAVHQYPVDHYGLWQADLGSLECLSRPGAFGENLSVAGLSESDVAVGDVYRLGQALIEVSQGRQPCWKLNVRFGVPDMALRVQRSGRTGWYYRVLEAGYVQAGDSLQLVDRRAPEWTLHRLWRAFYVDKLNGDELAGIAALGRLSESWRHLAERRLVNRSVEDWSTRLYGPDQDRAGESADRTPRENQVTGRAGSEDR
ncbi:MOSC domain-containing protein [Rhodovibrio salinarum]|uniref:MOSC domain-containing protein n=1 Tax=Rhodovibrio salinarum TaxID=1087 RepID=A0A934QIL0_9PROT|nr:MOSC domain-containing protein [Rhodovibrio salinarum]MBK1697110.1 MOSC domain-containing protein [Rhodovibrio salinarum]